ncbi:nucleoside hydrolase [Afifella pfennigii]|uniref:nucleoside hydrolase n=1 Tax=Afifella pfennigii TaxID=209897 RepID=UPI000A05CA51
MDCPSKDARGSGLNVRAVITLTRLRGVGIAILAAGIEPLVLPVHSWRTGESPTRSLVAASEGVPEEPPRAIWIDSDLACGVGGQHDPDDCWAILRLFRAAGPELTGISTVFGNAEVSDTDRTARLLFRTAGVEGHGSVLVHRGAAGPLQDIDINRPNPVVVELRAALSRGRISILALGPLTNFPTALHGRPDLHQNVYSILAVMGRTPRHVFHFSEGVGRRFLCGFACLISVTELVRATRPGFLRPAMCGSVRWFARDVWG